MTDRSELDRLIRLEIARRQSRRRFLGRMGATAGAFALGPALLAACGSDDDNGGSETGSGSTGTVARTESDTLRISNWPLYIDEETVPAFEAASGLTVEYTEDVNDNEEYFAKIREPLDRGQDVGADLFIVTDFLVARLINLGWLAPYDSANVPNKANLVDNLASVDYDPDRTYSLPYQSGFSGLAYNMDVTGREITSIDDLWDPEFSGKITLFSDLRDGLGMIIASQKGNLDSVTEEDVQAAADLVNEQKESGQIRRFTGNDYADDLVAGNTAIAQAYSGDVAQLLTDNPNLAFAIPETGAIIFSDNMVIPATTKNIVGAEKWMDFLYDPENAARLAEYVQYISPVKGAAELLPAELQENPLINPSAEELAASWVFPTLTEEEEVAYTEIYNQVTSG